MFLSLFLFVIAVESIFLYFIFTKYFDLLEKYESLTNQIEESLDIIDHQYAIIGKIAETPVFFDDPVVKQLMAAIKETQNSILLIANKISTPDEDDL